MNSMKNASDVNNLMIAVYHYVANNVPQKGGHYLNFLIDVDGPVLLSEIKHDLDISWCHEGLGPFIELETLKKFMLNYCQKQDRSGVRLFVVHEYNAIIDKCTQASELVVELRNAPDEMGEFLENTSKKQQKGIFSKLFQ